MNATNVHLPSSMKNLKPGSRIHLMGICGTAMASLAGLLQAQGFQISGSDSNPYPPMSTQLADLGIPILKPYAASNLHPKPDFVVVGNVISKTNPEAEELLKLGLPFCSFPQSLGEMVIKNKKSLVVCGTHGKTTTTSALTHVFEQVGLQPGFLIGGIPQNFTTSFRNPVGDYFVVEGDEYDTAFFDKVPKFIHYRPNRAILTSVEFDHADIYANLDAVMAAFARLMKIIPKEGALICNADDPNIQKLLPLCQARVITYGAQAGADWQLVNEKNVGEKNEFLVRHRGREITVQTSMSGTYNCMNLLAVMALASDCGVDEKAVVSAIANFQGVKRRQEILGEPGGRLLIEDFAHHPTAVKVTLEGIRKRYPERKIFAVFEPRSATSRRRIFQKDYGLAFKVADSVVLARAFDQSKISEADRFSSEELVEDLKNNGQQAESFATANDIVSHLVQKTRSGDIIVVMSNGGFDGIYKNLIASLSS